MCFPWNIMPSSKTGGHMQHLGFCLALASVLVPVHAPVSMPGGNTVPCSAFTVHLGYSLCWARLHSCHWASLYFWVSIQVPLIPWALVTTQWDSDAGMRFLRVVMSLHPNGIHFPSNAVCLCALLSALSSGLLLIPAAQRQERWRKDRRTTQMGICW